MKVLAACLACLATLASADAAPAVALRHATFDVPGVGTKITGDILIENGRIKAVGRTLNLPAGVRSIDVGGKNVTTGFLAFSPDLTANSNISDQDDPASSLVPLARRKGISRVVSSIADCKAVFCGTARMVHTGSGFDTAVTDSVGVWVRLESMGIPTHPDLWNKVSNTLADARAYKVTGSSEALRQVAQRTPNADLSALGPVLDGQVPLLVVAEHADVMTHIARLAEAQKIKLIIFDGGEAWKIAPLLAALHIPVAIPVSKTGLSPAQSKALSHLVGAKCDVILAVSLERGGSAPSPAATVAVAAAGGVKAETALAALSATPARVFKQFANYGTLLPGKDADIVVWSVPPTTPGAEPVQMFVRGEEVSLSAHGDGR